MIDFFRISNFFLSFKNVVIYMKQNFKFLGNFWLSFVDILVKNSDFNQRITFEFNNLVNDFSFNIAFNFQFPITEKNSKFLQILRF